MSDPIPEAYSPVLERIASGKTITVACAECGIEPQAYYRARKSNPHLQAAHLEAQEIGLEAMADSLQNIHETIGNPLMARVVSENRRWLLARRLADRYGDRIAVDANVNNDLVSTLREAIARIPRPASDQTPTIEGETLTIAGILGASASDP